MEPQSPRNIRSLVGEHFTEQAFADTEIAVPTVNPERTFLEKIFLLHEEFQKPAEKMRVERLSRHLYDIEKLMDTEFALKALGEAVLYKEIVEHRRTLTALKGIDYANHHPGKIHITPPKDVMDAWKKDYQQMQQLMIHGKSLTFEALIERIVLLTERIHHMRYE